MFEVRSQAGLSGVYLDHNVGFTLQGYGLIISSGLSGASLGTLFVLEYMSRCRA